jgi:shikimate dehydrogenase
MDQVNFVNGKTRVYGIVGDPIEQVRSPEMVTWEMQKRYHNAVLIPMHIATPLGHFHELT